MCRLPFHSVFIACLSVLALLHQPQASAAEDAPSSDNMLPSASFEQLEDDRPTGWRQSRWQGEGSLDVAEQGRSGEHSLLIKSSVGADIGWSATVGVEPHSIYRLSGWIKTEQVEPVADRAGRGALFNLHSMQGVATPAVTGTQDWTRVETVFETGGDDVVQVNCLFGGWGLATGRAWFDDVKLELVSTTEWNPTIAIDAEASGHPVSKYIYGQFIEHLGRCIYGGIWAEMLEDRKFYYPVTGNYAPYGHDVPEGVRFPVLRSSPWEIQSADGAVTMVNSDSFVGEHTPLVASGTTIAQHELGVVEGKKYVGYVWLKSSEANASVRVQLDPATGTEVFQCGEKEYTQHEFEFTATGSTNEATLTIAVEGAPCFVGTVSLMPADNVQGMRADTLALLRELDSPVYRWPGGNFVSGYNWKDGIGDRDRRPPRTNPAWTGVEHNDFGLDEFMTFCELLDTEPYIAVNSGLGGVENAVEELQYANGGANTPMGKRRARNGHPEPYNVKWWGIGNEMYGSWQLGHMSLEEYIAKHNKFADAMWKEDSSIKLVAVGATGPWSEGMMQNCAEHMDLISEHFYCQERQGLASHVAQIPSAVRAKAEAHRRYRERFEELEGKDIDIALDEWNYWYGPHVYGELGTRYFLKDALGIAAGVHEYVRQSDIMFMANYAQTVNVIGCIKTTKTDAAFATTGLVLKLYRAHFGSLPVGVTTSSPLDVAAALTEDRSALTLGIVNPTRQELELPIRLMGVKLAGTGTRWQLTGPDPMAYNVPGEPPKVTVKQSDVEQISDSVTVPACSVTLLRLDVEQ